MGLIAATLMGMDVVPPARFGRSHLSLLAYFESCAEKHGGAFEPHRMACNPVRHPGWLTGDGDVRGIMAEQWWGTDGLKTGSDLAGGERLAGHDDFDAAADLACAGLVEVAWQARTVQLTEAGWKLAQALRRHRASYGNFHHANYSDFVMPPMRHDVHAGNQHEECTAPAACSCECGPCKRTWEAAGRPKDPGEPRAEA